MVVSFLSLIDEDLGLIPSKCEKSDEGCEDSYLRLWVDYVIENFHLEALAEFLSAELSPVFFYFRYIGTMII